MVKDEESTLEGALQNEFLAFAGGEILSIFDPELVAPGQYLVSTVRARFDTRRETHPVDQGVFVIRKADLKAFYTRYDPLTQAYRCQPFLQQNALDLADCPELVHTIGFRAYRPLAPRNLRVKGDGHAPTYSAGEDIVASWTVTDVRRPLWPVTQVLSPDILLTVLEVWTLGGSSRGPFSSVDQPVRKPSPMRKSLLRLVQNFPSGSGRISGGSTATRAFATTPSK